MRWACVVLTWSVLMGGCAREETPTTMPVVPDTTTPAAGEASEVTPTAKPSTTTTTPAPEPEGSFAVGKAAFEAGKTNEAVTQLREAVIREPKNAEAYYYLGRAYQARRRTAEAARAYQSAVRLDADYMWPHYDLGRLLMDQKQHDEAIASYRRAIALKGDYAWSHFYLGRCLEAKGNSAGAVGAYEAALKHAPRNVHMLQTLAAAHASTGDKTRAIKTYETIAAHGNPAQVKAATDAIARLKGETVTPPQQPPPVKDTPAPTPKK